MTDSQNIRFQFGKITTDEFTLTNEKYDPAKDTRVNILMGFGFGKSDATVQCRVKALTLQENKVLVELAVTATFRITPEDWAQIFNAEQKVFHLSKALAIHLAGLTVSTTRGIQHVKTEAMPVNAAILPPINMLEMIKEDVRLEVND